MPKLKHLRPENDLDDDIDDDERNKLIIRSRTIEAIDGVCVCGGGGGCTSKLYVHIAGSRCPRLRLV